MPMIWNARGEFDAADSRDDLTVLLHDHLRSAIDATRGLCSHSATVRPQEPHRTLGRMSRRNSAGPYAPFAPNITAPALSCTASGIQLREYRRQMLRLFGTAAGYNKPWWFQEVCDG
ncbi:hypothetical protein OH76DRAFT_517407 [Lentinus brumalis]|uniref:Uncharacterized protein n=1 Tax=Lentinus brumalis TaxID=2498619 RepID=A0A371DAM1_9APHY|nr:hypothetical protein OH76DRAFT_517407 [Polyporus brumalis]